MNPIRWLFNVVIGQFLLFEGDGDGGGGSPDFKESLGEYSGNPIFSNFEDVGQLAKSYAEAKAYQGSSIRIPGEDAGEDALKEFNEKLLAQVPNLMAKPNFDNEEQSQEFYRQLGMPEKSDGYEIPKIEGIDPDEIDEDTTKFMRELFHKIGVNKHQFKVVSQEMIKRQYDQKITKANEINEGMKALRNEWGNAYPINIEKAKQAAIDTGAPDNLIKAIGLNEVDAVTLKWLYGVGGQLGKEGNQVSNQGGDGGNIPMTPLEAHSKIDEIMNNKEHPYWVSAHPQHGAAINRMVELQRHANP